MTTFAGGSSGEGVTLLLTQVDTTAAGIETANVKIVTPPRSLQFGDWRLLFADKGIPGFTDPRSAADVCLAGQLVVRGVRRRRPAGPQARVVHSVPTHRPTYKDLRLFHVRIAASQELLKLLPARKATFKSELGRPLQWPFFHCFKDR